MARGGPPKVMKMRLSYLAKINNLDRVFTGAAFAGAQSLRIEPLRSTCLCGGAAAATFAAPVPSQL